MSGAAPSDLSAAFRSFARRHRETADAAADADKTADVAPHLAAVSSTVAAAAAAIGVDAPSDLGSAGTAIAAGIDAIEADDWTGELLDRLRELASEAGQHLRRADDALDR